MKKSNVFFAGIMAVSLAIGFFICGTIPAAAQSKANQAKKETQDDKFWRLVQEDNNKLNVSTYRDSNNNITVQGIEIVFKPQLITGIEEIVDTKLKEPGYPYYFKLRAIYKGYDTKAERLLLQNLGKQSDVGDAVWGAAFGIDTNTYPLRHVSSSLVSTFPTDANAIATFYLIAVRRTEDDRGVPGNDITIFVRFVRNIEKPVHDISKFIVASGMHYITVNDAHVTTQQDVMTAYFLGSDATNSSGSVFDPIVYPMTDLMDARAAMNRKDIRNNTTFPSVRVKYVSEVVFKGQTNTNITVSTTDNVLTEIMTFTGRASSVKNGERVRVYYTIVKDPVEKWEIQAIERL